MDPTGTVEELLDMAKGEGCEGMTLRRTKFSSVIVGILKTLPDESVKLLYNFPPYLGSEDYGVGGAAGPRTNARG